jgi:ribosomal protein L7/L12
MEYASFIAMLIACIALYTALGVANRVSELEKNVYRLQAHVRRLYKQTGIVFEPEIDKKLHELLSSGKKILAIKQYREMTGKGLKDSKDAVEAIMRGEDAPDL